MKSASLQVEGRAINGAGPEQLTAELRVRTLASRLRESGIILGIGLVVGLVLLPIPLIHIVGIFVFLGCGFFAVKRFHVRTLLRGATGICPSCRQETRFHVGGGLMGVRWPFKAQCARCGIAVELTPDGSAAGRERTG